ncbi:GntR family transcriptional regulator [Flaviflagellibacter deserti]|uniref:GntR family transcriptional regulator n=1 Tax=Flaviflagellibacter deserti TaxID=2267266 RepID=A0ABV9Z740_9HYPH
MSEQGLISRRSLHGELVDLLHDMVLEGELRPGDKINEQALCARFGVSRTPLREALKVLASGGLVILSPNRGASVARISPEEVNELFPIMGALEALAGELACARITDASVAQIRKLHEAMLRHYERKEASKYLKLNRDIHEAIFAAAGNNELTQLYHTLMVRTHAVRFTAKKSEARWDEAVADHVEMMDALEKRDGAKLSGLLKVHLRHKAAMVHESLETSDKAAE